MLVLGVECWRMSVGVGCLVLRVECYVELHNESYFT